MNTIIVDIQCVNHYSVCVEAKDIRVLRRRLGMSQMGFSKRYGINFYTLKTWERGGRISMHGISYLQMIRRTCELKKKLKGNS